MGGGGDGGEGGGFHNQFVVVRGIGWGVLKDKHNC